MKEFLTPHTNGNPPVPESETVVTGESFVLSLSDVVGIQYPGSRLELEDKTASVLSVRPVFVRCDEKGDLEVVPEDGEGVHLAIEAVIPDEPPMYFSDPVKALFQDGSAALVRCALSPDRMPEANIDYTAQNGQVQIPPAA